MVSVPVAEWWSMAWFRTPWGVLGQNVWVPGLPSLMLGRTSKVSHVLFLNLSKVVVVANCCSPVFN